MTFGVTVVQFASVGAFEIAANQISAAMAVAGADITLHGTATPPF